MAKPELWILLILAVAIVRVSTHRFAPARPYQTFWRRFFAAWVDGIIFWPLEPMNDWVIRSGAPPILLASWFIACSCLPFFYYIFCHARWGQTVGKWVFGVRVLDISESPLRPWQAVLRDAIPLALTLLLVVRALMRGEYRVELSGPAAAVDGVAYVSAAWFLLEVLTMLTNRKRRALHDFIAGSVVVRVVPFQRRESRQTAH